MIINILSLKIPGFSKSVSLAWLAILLLPFVGKGLFAQPGALDSTFSQDGKVIVSIERDYGSAVLIQSDGKVVVAGTVQENNIWKFAILRFTTDGTLDNSFDGDGKLTVNMENTSVGYGEAWDAVLQADGKIVVCGSTDITGNYKDDWAILRVNTNGTLDNSFDGDGKLRLNLTSGSSVDQARAITYNDVSGKITVAGDANLQIGVVRLNTDGSLDNTFGSNGKAITSLPNGFPITYAAIQKDDTIWVGGKGGPSTKVIGFVAKYTDKGLLDKSFGANGFATLEEQNWQLNLYALCRQPDGKILAAGSAGHTSSDSSEIFLGRLMPNGQPDQSFGTNGVIILNISPKREEAWKVLYDTVRQKILLAGFSEKNGGRQFALARFNPDGQQDDEFGTNGLVLTTVGLGWAECKSTTIQPDGKIVSVGDVFNGASYDFAVTRHLQDGTNVVNDFGNKLKNTIIVYPNPVWNEIHVQYSLLNADYVSVDLWDSFGRRVKSFIVQERRSAGEHTEEFSSDGLPGGLYFLFMYTSNAMTRQGYFVKN